MCAALLSSLCIAIAIEQNCRVELAIHKVYSFCRFGRLLCALCFQPSGPLNFHRQMENMQYKRIKAKRRERIAHAVCILANLLFLVLAFANAHISFDFEFCRAHRAFNTTELFEQCWHALLLFANRFCSAGFVVIEDSGRTIKRAGLAGCYACRLNQRFNRRLARPKNRELLASSAVMLAYQQCSRAENAVARTRRFASVKKFVCTQTLYARRSFVLPFFFLSCSNANRFIF